MESSRLSGKSSGWKNSILKRGQQESRIISDSKEFPSKFSPAKNIEPQPRHKILGRSTILNHSHEQIVIGRAKSGGKQSSVRQRPTAINTPPTPQVQPQLKRLPSLISSQLCLSPRKRPMKVSQDSMEFLHDIKLEYIRFRDKINKEMKKLQNDIKAAIDQVMSIVQNYRPKGQMAKSPSLEPAKLPVLNMPSSPSIDSSSKMFKPSAKMQMPPSVFIDTKKYRDLTSSDAAIESVLPKIKERMSKFFDLMGRLKTEINQQAMYSPVGTKTGQFGPT